MRVLSLDVRSIANGVEPAIQFGVGIGYEQNAEVLTDLIATVQAGKKSLGVARLLNWPSLDRVPLHARTSSDQSPERQVTVQLVLPLTLRIVEFLDENRHERQKSDVQLLLNLQLMFFRSKAVVPHVEPDEKAQGSRKQALLYENLSTPHRSRQTDLYLVSGDGSPAFLELQRLEQVHGVAISAGDWLHDYLSPWRSTRYMTVEFPQPELLTSPSTPNLEARVNTAIDAARRADEKMQKGEWTDVILALRPIWELVRKNGQADVSNLLRRDGYSQDAVNAFNDAIQGLFTLASKFIHRVDQSGANISPELRASKEDARMCYSVAMAALDLIAKKTARLNS